MDGAHRLYFTQPHVGMRGFSLVELSIVLVILGLLTGGILTGQSLIRAAELRSVVSDAQRYQAAVMAFRDRYMNLPGDMPHATDFWGVAAGTAGTDLTCYNTVSTDAKTCNGNGNGRLIYWENGDDSAPEWYRAWQHLANAGLVEGTYTGTRDGTDRLASPGKNVPRSKISNAGFTLMSMDGTTDTPGNGWWKGVFDGLIFGTQTAGVETGNVALKPEEAWNIDKKTDDGKPSTGFVRTVRGHTACHTADLSTADYAVRTTTVACSLFFNFGHPN